jgi:hypothetical protein
MELWCRLPPISGRPEMAAVRPAAKRLWRHGSPSVQHRFHAVARNGRDARDDFAVDHPGPA